MSLKSQSSETVLSEINLWISPWDMNDNSWVSVIVYDTLSPLAGIVFIHIHFANEAV